MEEVVLYKCRNDCNAMSHLADEAAVSKGKALTCNCFQRWLTLFGVNKETWFR